MLSRHAIIITSSLLHISSLRDYFLTITHTPLSFIIITERHGYFSFPHTLLLPLLLKPFAARRPFSFFFLFFIFIIIIRSIIDFAAAPPLFTPRHVTWLLLYWWWWYWCRAAACAIRQGKRAAAADAAFYRPRRHWCRCRCRRAARAMRRRRAAARVRAMRVRVPQRVRAAAAKQKDKGACAVVLFCFIVFIIILRCFLHYYLINRLSRYYAVSFSSYCWSSRRSPRLFRRLVLFTPLCIVAAFDMVSIRCLFISRRRQTTDMEDGWGSRYYIIFSFSSRFFFIIDRGCIIFANFTPFTPRRAARRFAGCHAFSFYYAFSLSPARSCRQRLTPFHAHLFTIIDEFYAAAMAIWCCRFIFIFAFPPSSGAARGALHYAFHAFCSCLFSFFDAFFFFFFMRRCARGFCFCFSFPSSRLLSSAFLFDDI